MFARLHALLVIVCFASLMAVIPAWSADPDQAKSTSERGDTQLSADAKDEDEKPDQPVAKPQNAAVGGQEQPGNTGKKVEEQTASRPELAGETKPGGDSVSPGLQAGKDALAGTTARLDQPTCLVLKKAAEKHGLPVEFFARVIWTESRFKHNAIGPTTRTGHRAQGIAQFMPYTATARGLADPFNPELALPEAAEFLAELRREFGNLGLAAAAYNAGPGRVHKFLNKQGGMPGETRHYVHAITGHTVQEWAALGREKKKKSAALPTSCRVLAELVKERPVFAIGRVARQVAQETTGSGGTLDSVRTKDSIALQPANLQQIKGSADLPQHVSLQPAKGSLGLQNSRDQKTPGAKGKRTRKGRATASISNGDVPAKPARLTSISPQWSSKPAGRANSEESRFRRSRAVVSTRNKRKSRSQARSVIRGKRLARDDRIDKIMRICSGCGL